MVVDVWRGWPALARQLAPAPPCLLHEKEEKSPSWPSPSDGDHRRVKEESGRKSAQTISGGEGGISLPEGVT